MIDDLLYDEFEQRIKNTNRRGKLLGAGTAAAAGLGGYLLSKKVGSNPIASTLAALVGSGIPIGLAVDYMYKKVNDQKHANKYWADRAIAAQYPHGAQEMRRREDAHNRRLRTRENAFGSRRRSRKQRKASHRRSKRKASRR